MRSTPTPSINELVADLVTVDAMRRLMMMMKIGKIVFVCSLLTSHGVLGLATPLHQGGERDIVAALLVHDQWQLGRTMQ